MKQNKKWVSFTVSCILMGGLMFSREIFSQVSNKLQNEQNLNRNQYGRLTETQFKPGIVRHFVAFKFKKDIDQVQISKVVSNFLALKTLCVRNGTPYIVSIEVGKANSFEGADQGKQIGFLVTFKSEGDRNYYIGQPLIPVSEFDFYDPAHLRFKNFVGPLLETPVVPNGVFVFDFTLGK